MAMAGYDPREAVRSGADGPERGGAPPEFMSTHPPMTRGSPTSKLMPEALKYYQPPK